MHEMSIAQSILDLAAEEMQKTGCNRLLLIRIEYGALAGIMPEALELCFEALTRGTAYENAKLEMVELPLRLRCPMCQASFGGKGREALLEPCPQCGEFFGHIVEQGRELILSHLEACRE